MISILLIESVCVYGEWNVFLFYLESPKVSLSLGLLALSGKVIFGCQFLFVDGIRSVVFMFKSSVSSQQ